MLPEDTEATARHSARLFDDPRLRQFYDVERRVGRAIARSLGFPDEVAWDIYLFYQKGQIWADSPPMRYAWVHQMSAGWAGATHRCCGKLLDAELRTTMERLLNRCSA